MGNFPGELETREPESRGFEKRFRPGVDRREELGLGEDYEVAVVQMGYVLEALQQPGSVIEIPKTHDRRRVYALSADALRAVVPPAVARAVETQADEEGRECLVFANGSVIRCSDLDWYQEG